MTTFKKSVVREYFESIVIAVNLNQQYPIWKQGRAVFTPSAPEDEDEK